MSLHHRISIFIASGSKVLFLPPTFMADALGVLSPSVLLEAPLAGAEPSTGDER